MDAVVKVFMLAAAAAMAVVVYAVVCSWMRDEMLEMVCELWVRLAMLVPMSLISVPQRPARTCL